MILNKFSEFDTYINKYFKYFGKCFIYFWLVMDFCPVGVPSLSCFKTGALDGSAGFGLDGAPSPLQPQATKPKAKQQMQI